MKRTLWLITALLLCLTLLPAGALAAEDADDVEIVETEADVAEAAPEDGISEQLPPEEAVPEEAGPAEGGRKFTSDDCAYPMPAEDDPLPPESGDGQSAVVVIETDGISSDEAAAVIEDRTSPDGFTIGGQNIPIRNGSYSYQLVIRGIGDLTFDNDLAISYQGVDGRYQLHYEIDGPDDHIMIVNGTFGNIMTASPLLKRIRDRISEDSYSYQLDLRTKEGFTFSNELSFLLDGNRHGWSISCGYDRLTDRQSLEITGSLLWRPDRSSTRTCLNTAA